MISAGYVRSGILLQMALTVTPTRIGLQRSKFFEERLGRGLLKGRAYRCDGGLEDPRRLIVAALVLGTPPIDLLAMFCEQPPQYAKPTVQLRLEHKIGGRGAIDLRIFFTHLVLLAVVVVVVVVSVRKYRWRWKHHTMRRRRQRQR